MVLNQEILEIIRSSPFANDVIAAIALLCSVAAIAFKPLVNWKWLAASCVIALSIPLFDFVYSYIRALVDGGSVSEPFMVIVMILMFSPANIVILLILGFIKMIKHITIWSCVVFISILANWFGIAALHYAASA